MEAPIAISSMTLYDTGQIPSLSVVPPADVLKGRAYNPPMYNPLFIVRLPLVLLVGLCLAIKY